MTWRELVKKGKAVLESAGIEDAEFDAFQLSLKFFNGSHTDYLLHFSDEVNEADFTAYFNFLNRRISGEPLQYIVGKWDFYKSSFYVGKGVLIPRPETEELVDSCIGIIKKNDCKVIYDLCTGSGCIGISIAKECPETKCYLFDYYDDAISYAERNLNLSGLSNVKVIKHNILTPFSENVPVADLIVSNPPYINSSELASLQQEVLQEPITALDGGEDGLMFYRAIFSLWEKHLKPNGYFAFECGENQAELIKKLAGNKFNTTITKDIYGIERFVFSEKIKEELYD